MATPLPTVPVLCTAQDQTGAPLAGGKFEATLDRLERYHGFLVPQVVTGIADADGACVLDLWPNSLGTAGSTYRVRAWHGVTGKRYLDAVALVPDAACALQDILIAEPLPPVNDALQALAAAQAALAPVTAQAYQSLLNANRADDAKTGAEIAAVAALTHSQAAALSSFEATTAASDVQADVVTILAQAGVATGSAAAAQASAAAAGTSAAQALAHEAAASLSAGLAAGHADTAQQQAAVAVQASADGLLALATVASQASAVAADKSTAAAAAQQAAVDAASALDAKTAAVAAASQAVSAKDSATSSASTATTQAANAGTSATGAAASAATATAKASAAAASAAIYGDVQISLVSMATSLVATQAIVANFHSLA